MTSNAISHFIELRSRVIQCTIIWFLLFLSLFWVDETLYNFIAKPLLQTLPQGSLLIATEVTTPFIVPMKLALITAFFLTIPFLLYHLWAFVAPGLYPNEKRYVFPLLVSSLILFYLGVFFSYGVICPLSLSFFAKSAPTNVTLMTDIRSYLDFVLTILLAGGIAFQVPIVTVALIQSQLISIQQLTHLRPYVIVTAFVLGMLLTPPDVVSQVLLALPMWGLFEVGLLIAHLFLKPNPLAIPPK